MYSMRTLVLTAFITALVTLAWAAGGPTALLVKFKLPPGTNVVKPTAIVDGNGNILFNSTTPGQVQVTNFPPQASAGDFFSIVLSADDNYPTSSMTVATVPTDRQLVITDIDGKYQCPGGQQCLCGLVDSSGVRLVWTDPEDFADGTEFRHSFATGVRFAPGETVAWSHGNPACGDIPLAGRITFLGRLLPLS
jgi:hypothetical protein